MLRSFGCAVALYMSFANIIRSCNERVAKSVLLATVFMVSVATERRLVHWPVQGVLLTVSRLVRTRRPTKTREHSAVWPP